MAVDFDVLVLAPLIDAVFGEPITWQPLAGAPVAVNGVFDAAYRDLKFDNEQQIVATRPRLGCRIADLGEVPAEGDSFLVRGQTYLVSEPPLIDGIGHVEIFLHGPV